MTEHASNSRPLKSPSLLDSSIPLLALIALLGLSFYLFGDEASYGPNQIALFFSMLVAAGIAWKNGIAWNELRDAALNGVSTGLAAIGILLAVGALIGTWALSGTISAMVYYGLQIMQPNYFYATTAVICAVVALSIGSSWTVAGTIGIGMMGIAESMGLSPAITAGAVISGAYFGDKASPLSDTANLACAAAGSELFSHIRESLWTSVPSLAIAVVIFSQLGTAGDFDATPITDSMNKHVTISLWSLLPLLLVFVLSVKRAPPFLTIFLGALFGGVMAVILDPERVKTFANAPQIHDSLQLLKGVWMSLANGYHAETGNVMVDKLLTRGGMASMLVTIWLIIAALSYGAVLEHAGFLQRLIAPLISGVKSAGGFALSLVSTCIGANLFTCDQYISIVLPARLFRPEAETRGFAPVFLSRIVGDSATVTSPLIPWNSCGAYMAAALGVSSVAYFPYCFFNILNPLLTVIFSMIGWRVLRAGKTPSDNEISEPS
jgi:NhaC family Na+:H+ antiporter